MGSEAQTGMITESSGATLVCGWWFDGELGFAKLFV